MSCLASSSQKAAFAWINLGVVLNEMNRVDPAEMLISAFPDFPDGQ
jgi:hypothetical protein